jgi:hypothetical protein
VQIPTSGFRPDNRKEFVKRIEKHMPCAMYVIERCLAMTAVVAFKLPVS